MTAILFLCFALVALIGHGYFWVAIVNRMHGLSGPRKLIDGVTLASFVAFLAMPLYLLFDIRNLFDHWMATWSESASLSVRYFQLCLAVSVCELVAKQFFAPKKNDPRALLNVEKQLIDTVGISGSPYRGSYGNFLGRVPGNQSSLLQIERKRIFVPRLHENHQGLRIAHISDLHLTGRIEKTWYETVVDQVNALEPDVIALTGDIVENSECLEWLEDTVCQLQAKQGVYFILGNHDRFVDQQRTKEILLNAGLICLSSNCLEVSWNEAPVVLAGNERPWIPEIAAVPPATERKSTNLPLRLFLLHTPDQWHWAIENDADLVLAGHTHGGQLCFPVLGAVACPSLYGTKYADGVFRNDQHVMHVTRGLSGRTPLRWLCPPEIALLELVGGQQR